MIPALITKRRPVRDGSTRAPAPRLGARRDPTVAGVSGRATARRHFLSQIVNYEDLSLEKLSIYLRHLAPVISSEQLNHEIDLSTVDFDFLTQHKGETTSGKPTGDVPLQPAKESGTGSARDPELVALDDVIAQINDLFSGDHPDSSVRNVVTHIKDTS